MVRIHDLPERKQAPGRLRRVLMGFICAALAAAVTPVTAQGDRFGTQKTASMTFTHGRLPGTKGCGLPCAEFIVADGTIAITSSFSYLIAQKKLGERMVPVLLDSPGGNLLGSDALAHMFRRLGATVIVARARERKCGAGQALACDPDDEAAGVKVFDLAANRAECESGCPFALMGGVKRVVPAGARIGLHAPELDADTVVGGALLAVDPKAKETAKETDFEDMASIARAMGVDEAIVTRALKTPHSKMEYISQNDIAAYRLGNATLAEAGLSESLLKALSAHIPAKPRNKAAGNH